jgi:hypothetical protein
MYVKWLSLLWSHPALWNHDLIRLECTISRWFHVNLSFFATVELQRIFNDRSGYSIFAFKKINFSFEEDLVLHLNNLKFLHPRIVLYQV